MEIPVRKKVLIDTGDGGFNGSLAPHGVGWVYVYRCGGITHGRPISQRHCLLDREYQPVAPIVEFSSGRELDPRIVQLADSYLVVSGFHPLSTDPVRGRSSPRLRRLTVEAGVVRLSDPVPLESPDLPLRAVEKNWLPFVVDRRVHLVYKAEPHVILELGAGGLRPRTHVSQQNLRWRWGAVSGGTPPLRIGPGEYLTFFHSHLSADPVDYRTPRVYFAGAYTFRARPPFEITRVTHEPLSWEGLGEAGPSPAWHRVVFPSGLQRRGDDLVLVYGENDAFSFALETPIEALLGALRPVRAAA